MLSSKKIKSILLDDCFEMDSMHGDTFEGVRIILDDNSEIRFGISNTRNCCEQFGFIEANELDNYDKFVGAKILEISCVRDTNAHFKEIVDLENDSDCMCLETEFINIKTTKGVMNFAVYTHHNGYYGHDVVACYIDNNKLESKIS